MNELLRKIPKVDELLRDPALRDSLAYYGDYALTEAIRVQLDDLRQEILAKKTGHYAGAGGIVPADP